VLRAHGAAEVQRLGSVAGEQAVRARPLVRVVVTCRYDDAVTPKRFETLKSRERQRPEAKTSA